MLISELVLTANGVGFECTEKVVRTLIGSGKLPKPRLDATRRFDFTAADVERVIELLEVKAQKKAARQANKTQRAKTEVSCP